jgi:hypothetical protein
MTDRMKAAVAAPVGKLTRTADEQALVDAWQAKTQLDWPPRVKDGEEPGTVVADTKGHAAVGCPPGEGAGRR